MVLLLILFWDHSVSILCMCTGLKQVSADIQMWMCLSCPVLVHHTGSYQQAYTDGKFKYWFLPQNHNYGGCFSRRMLQNYGTGPIFIFCCKVPWSCGFFWMSVSLSVRAGNITSVSRMLVVLRRAVYLKQVCEIFDINFSEVSAINVHPWKNCEILCFQRVLHIFQSPPNT